ncbi:hypothetical protein V8G54_034090 [Vigna mungo]|uniref:PGG domain-containing protein n=1 Tax=Vigna mungo TaxID=3915 RepID=A0AAQ3MPU1_VIGMU
MSCIIISVVIESENEAKKSQVFEEKKFVGRFVKSVVRVAFKCLSLSGILSIIAQMGVNQSLNLTEEIRSWCNTLLLSKSCKIGPALTGVYHPMMAYFVSLRLLVGSLRFCSSMVLMDVQQWLTLILGHLSPCFRAQTLANRISYYPPSCYLSCFILGLKPHLRREVIAQKPPCLPHAIALTKLHDEKYHTSPPPFNRFGRTITPPSPTTIGTSTTPKPLPPFLPTPSTKLSIKHLTEAEMQTRREKNLCFNYDECYTRDTVVSHNSYSSLLMPQRSLTMTYHQKILNQLRKHNKRSDSLVSMPSLVNGFQGHFGLHDLSRAIGETHNFIQHRVAKFLHLTTQPTPSPLRVMESNWLSMVSPYIMDYNGTNMRFPWNGKMVELKGIQNHTLHLFLPTSVSLSVLNQELESAAKKEEKLAAYLTAARNGITEIVDGLHSKIPSVIYETSSKRENVLLVAVKNKQVNVVEMLQKSLKKENFDSLILETDDRRNTVLHLAAGTSSNERVGTTMQMIWDIKWYQYISGLVPKEFIYRRNKDGKTAWEIYELEHLKKVKDCSEALKDLSNSGSVVAALIAGISFATSTTVPGSTDDGKPILGGQPAFDVFATASLIGLGFSITALVMFLAILTSPKQVQHFRLSLPLKLIFGLGSLFASVASMLVSFWAAHFFVLNEKYNMILLPVYVATWFPITIYALMQFPFYVELVSAIFKKVSRETARAVRATHVRPGPSIWLPKLRDPAARAAKVTARAANIDFACSSFVSGRPSFVLSLLLVPF